MARSYKRDSKGRFAGGSGGSSGGGGGRKSAPRRRNTTIIGTPRGTARSRAARRKLIRNRVIKGAVAAYAGSLAYQAAKEAAIGRGTARFNQDKLNRKNRSGNKTLAPLRQSQFGSLPKATNRKRRSGAYKISKL